jgi:8-oxo-dGTP pyrophosphatase MutT (NUDIX family)
MSKGVFVIFLDSQNRVLFSKRKDEVGKYPAGVMELPGGTVDDGEGTDEAIAREVREETALLGGAAGFELDLSKLHGFAAYADNKGAIRSNYYLYRLDEVEAETLHRDLQPFAETADGEHTGFAWLDQVEISGLGRLDMLALHRDITGLALKELINTSEFELSQQLGGIDGDLYAIKVGGGQRQLWNEDQEGRPTIIVTYPIGVKEQQMHESKVAIR